LIPVLIADDEEPARIRLRDLLSRFGCFDIIAEAHNGNEALQHIITLKPAVAFLDINMPGVSVFDAIPSLQEPPLVVFQTAYSEHAARAYDINALDYLLKPIRFERLEKTVAKILERLTPAVDAAKPAAARPAARAEQITVTINGKTRIIPAHDIVRISLENECCCIYTATEKLVSDKYLNFYEEKLGAEQFFRTGRNDIINLDCVVAIHRIAPGIHSIELKGGAQVDLSRRRTQDLRKIIDF
jgi:two-component system LytT family response regulator